LYPERACFWQPSSAQKRIHSFPAHNTRFEAQLNERRVRSKRVSRDSAAVRSKPARAARTVDKTPPNALTPLVMASTFPQCARDASKPGFARTFVAKVTAASQVAIEWSAFQAHASQGANAVALVTRETDDNTIYIVLTRAAVRVDNHVPALKGKLEDPPLSATVEWVRPFTRRLQRLFGWGDVWASQEVLERALDEEDDATLLRMLPEQRLAIQCGDYDRVRMAVEALSGPSAAPALMDVDSNDEEDKKARLRAEHDAQGTHRYGQPSMKWECARCNSFPAARCEACGAQRCDKCTHDGATATAAPRPPHKVVWKQNAMAPEPFYVQNPPKLSLDQQAEWLRDELPAAATLMEFADVYRQLLADQVRDELKSRHHCLNLYGMFNPEFKPRKECELHPPSELEAFQRVFDPNAPARCRSCAAVVRPGGAYILYCSNKCHFAAHPPSKCSKCGGEEHEVVPNPMAPSLDLLPAPRPFLARCKVCKRLWECDATARAYDPTRMKRPAAAAEPAYKMRRRS